MHRSLQLCAAQNTAKISPCPGIVADSARILHRCCQPCLSSMLQRLYQSCLRKVGAAFPLMRQMIIQWGGRPAAEGCARRWNLQFWASYLGGLACVAGCSLWAPMRTLSRYDAVGNEVPSSCSRLWLRDCKHLYWLMAWVFPGVCKLGASKGVRFIATTDGKSQCSSVNCSRRDGAARHIALLADATSCLCPAAG